jgi:rhamnopyranosyl-N-acetylglucosaminyl-diphospho-decaprenol beta-1,3/1,4-galactofuranosyltransferase
MPVSQERVCAVVVTFNREALLRDCLRTLMAQTRPVDEIVIVNNASTDGTGAMLATEYPQLRILQQPENLGGAGGFHAGMKWAVEQKFDWVWVMDDDVRVKPDALEVMLSYGSLADMIHPRKRVNGTLLVWESVWDAQACTTITYATDISFENGRDWTSVHYSCFEGALIRRTLIERAGLPDIRYFIGGDDTIYGFIASLHGHVIYIRYEGLEKEAVVGRLSRLQLYLALRNRFLTFEIFERHGVPMNRKVFLLQQLYGLLQLWVAVLRDPALRTWTIFKSPLEGLVHGFKGRFGKPYWIK